MGLRTITKNGNEAVVDMLIRKGVETVPHWDWERHSSSGIPRYDGQPLPDVGDDKTAGDVYVLAFTAIRLGRRFAVVFNPRFRHEGLEEEFVTGWTLADGNKDVYKFQSVIFRRDKIRPGLSRQLDDNHHVVVLEIEDLSAWDGRIKREKYGLPRIVPLSRKPQFTNG